ncbi:MAG TPA: hypothetical protein VJR24_19005 [Gemmatimonadaceae bacterium]|nr:hypothetical protein [Gemmatimonadaceae bacterium]
MTTAVAPQIRERTAFEIVDVSIQLFRRHYPTFVMLAAIAIIPYLIVLWLSGFMSLMAGIRPVGPQIGLGSLAGLLIPLTLLWSYVFKGAVIVAASDAYLKGEVDPGRAIAAALSRSGALIGSAFLLGIAIFFGAIVFLIGAIYVYLRYFAVAPALLLEGTDVTNAFHRSRDLSQGFKWRILGTMLLSWLIFWVVFIALEVVVAFLPVSPLARQIVNPVAQLFVSPLVLIVLTVLYYDQRVRKDGFDLEVATRELAPAPVH